MLAATQLNQQHTWKPSCNSYAGVMASAVMGSTEVMPCLGHSVPLYFASKYGAWAGVQQCRPRMTDCLP